MIIPMGILSEDRDIVFSGEKRWRMVQGEEGSNNNGRGRGVGITGKEVNDIRAAIADAAAEFGMHLRLECKNHCCQTVFVC